MPLFSRILPFFIGGIIIVILIAGLVLLSYLLVLGAFVGLILFMIAWFKNKIFPSKTIVMTKPAKEGQTFDHNEFK